MTIYELGFGKDLYRKQQGEEIPENESLGVDINATGISPGNLNLGRVQFLPDENTGMVVRDDADSKVFEIITGGTDVGDVIIGDSGGQHAKWDKSAGTFTITGTLTATSGTIGGWTIDATSIYTGTEDHSGYTANAGDITLYSNGTDASIHAKNWYIDTAGNLTCTGATIAGSTISTPTITGIQAGSEIAIQGWQSDLVFSATDADTVAWASGTITLLDGTTYSITGANTGNMAALTYIYLDIGVSTTALQTTTTAATAVGTGKILVAVAENNSDATSKATYQVFGGSGGQLLAVDNIAANSASTNEFVSNTAQIKDAIITNAKIDTLDVAKLTAGSITSKAITLAVSAGTGDVYIAAGKSDFTNTDSGFILGIDDSDGDKPKFYIGDANDYLNWDGSQLKLSNAGFGGLVIACSTSDNIQTAIDAVNTAGGGKVIILNGTHTPGQDLTLYSDVYLEGQNADSAIIDFESGAYSIIIKGSNNYSTGTVAVSNNATTVEGTGVTWTGMAGRKILLDGIWYLIASITDSDTLELAIPYAGNDLSGASYVIATTIEDVYLKYLTVKNSTTSAFEIQYFNEGKMQDVKVVACAKALDLDDTSNLTLDNWDLIACTDGFDVDNAHYVVFSQNGVVDTTNAGMAFNNCSNAVIDANFTLNCGGDGATFEDCESISVVNSTFSENTGQGVELVANNTNVFFNTCKFDNNGSDGIKLTATSDRCIVAGCIIDTNGGYGINIAASTCDDNTIGINQYNSNASGRWNDSGTGTTILQQDVEYVAGTKIIQSANTERSTASATYTVLKDISIVRDGTLTVDFEGKEDATGFARVYLDGVAAGTERALTTSYVNYSENIDVSKGQSVQVYAKATETFDAQDTGDYTEVDTDGKITLTSATVVTLASLDRDDTDEYVYQDYGAAYFGDFEFRVHVNMSAVVAAAGTGGIAYVWMLSNTLDGAEAIVGTADYLAVAFAITNDGVTRSIRLYEGVVATEYSDTYDSMTENTDYYLKIVRNGTDYKCYIYSDSGFSTLVDTLAITTQDQQTFRYLYWVNGRGDSASDGYVSGVIDNLKYYSVLTPQYAYVKNLKIKASKYEVATVITD